jgi:crossover junction endodeoxyribonuclease RuvC
VIQHFHMTLSKETAVPPRRRVMGIDPGKGGGWIVLDETGVLTDGGNIPLRCENGKTLNEIDGAMFSRFVEHTRPTVAYVELVNSRPRQAGVFQFGQTCGIILGVLQAHNIEIIRVSPQVWKTTVGIRRGEGTKASVKNEARDLASRLFPEDAHLFERVKDDGVAEAALIALHGLGHQSALKGANT